MWKSMKNAPKGRPMHPHKFIALVRRRGFEDFLPVICFWAHGLNIPRWVFDGQKSGEEPMYWLEQPYGALDDVTQGFNPFHEADKADAAITAQQVEQDRCDLIVREEWHAGVSRYALRPGSVTEEVVGNILYRIRFDPTDPE